MTGSTHRTSTTALTLGSLGVVFGDIGTSPLYAFRESLGPESEIEVLEASVLGVLSLIFWSLILVITLKYLAVVLRADNNGEGGILALSALVVGRDNPRRNLILLSLFGTALLYGDGMITPAISVLSAVEGVKVAAPGVEGVVIPIVIVILFALFSVQRFGTEMIGRFFGPVMLVWFAVIGLLGLVSLSRHPAVLEAIDPRWAGSFLSDNGLRGFLVLGSVFLVVTGGEALYADMGHFGRRPITQGWFSVVLPCLLLNYFGQGALLLSDASAVENPFFLLAPSWAQWPLTVLATAATIIASQALITGAFSLTVQAINMDYLPRMKVVQTSSHHRGQVYVPAVNYFLLAACIGLVLAFRSSSNLAAAYGVAVTATMAITTILVAVVARHRWNWSTAATAGALLPLLLVDLAFLTANLFKIPKGGWFPLVVGGIGFAVFTTWRTGRALVAAQLERQHLDVPTFVASLAKSPPSRHAGTGVYLHRQPDLVPPALLANLRHNDSLHEDIVLVSISTSQQAHVHPAERHRWSHHDLGFHQLLLNYGFVEHVDLSRDLAGITSREVSFDHEHTTYFLGRERITVTDRPGMATWREHLFTALHRNVADPARHYGLPLARTMDIGSHIDL